MIRRISQTLEAKAVLHRLKANGFICLARLTAFRIESAGAVMAVTEQDITLALQTVADPLTGQDFVAAKAIKNISIQGGAVCFDLVLGYPAKSLWDSYKQQLEHVV